MRHIIKFVIVLVAALAFSVVLLPAHSATLQDALLDFLDKETVGKVADYFERTEGSRLVGMTMLLLFWSAVVIWIDRLFDLLMASRRKRSAAQS